MRAKKTRPWAAAIAGVLGPLVLAVYSVGEPDRAATPRVTLLKSAAGTATSRRLELASDGADRASALEGHVLAGGKPVAEAWVCAACLTCEATTADAAPCTRSDEDGAYSFAELAPTGYFVHATAEGFIPGTANNGEPVFVAAESTTTGVDIELGAGGVELSGTVVDATGGAIAHAHVRAVRVLPPRISLDVQADEHGRFAFPLRQGFIQLVAQAEGYARASLRATAPAQVEIRLVPGASVEGRVVIAGSTTPVSHVEVKAIAELMPQPALAPRDVTDQEGRFHVSGLEPGRYALDARGERSRGALRAPVELRVAEQRRELIIEVQPASSVAGQVLIEGEERVCRKGTVALGEPSPLDPPLAAEELARVTLGQAIDRIGPGEATDIHADGTVHFPGVQPGVYFVRVACEGHLLREGPRVMRVGEAPVEGVTWTVVPASRAVVRVVDARGRPVPQADFYLELPSRGARVVSSHRTDEAGVAVLEDLSPGSYALHAPDGYAEVAPVPFTVQEGAQDLELALALPGSGFAIVRVSNERAEPIDGLWIKAASATRQKEVPAQPLGAGAYRLGPLIAGTYEVLVQDGVNPPLAGNTADERVDVRDGEVVETLLRLERGGTIHGQVLDERGAPAPDVWISVAPDAPERGFSAVRAASAAQARPQRVLSDSAGQFSITGLAPDASFRVRATEPYGSAAAQAGVKPGERVTLQLLESATISGVALDAKGQPVTQLTVRAVNAELGTRTAQPVSDPEGRFSLTDIAPGTVQIALSAPGGHSASTTLSLTPGQHLAGLSLHLAPTGLGLDMSSTPAAK